MPSGFLLGSAHEDPQQDTVGGREEGNLGYFFPGSSLLAGHIRLKALSQVVLVSFPCPSALGGEGLY